MKQNQLIAGRSWTLWSNAYYSYAVNSNAFHYYAKPYTRSEEIMSNTIKLLIDVMTERNNELILILTILFVLFTGDICLEK